MDGKEGKVLNQLELKMVGCHQGLSVMEGDLKGDRDCSAEEVEEEDDDGDEKRNGHYSRGEIKKVYKIK